MNLLWAPFPLSLSPEGFHIIKKRFSLCFKSQNFHNEAELFYDSLANPPQKAIMHFITPNPS